MSEELTRPIIGIENRTAQEVFDIMVARIGATPPPHHNVVGVEAAIRKAGQIAIDHLIDTGITYEATNDDLADYLTRIVDACVRAALSSTEGTEG